MVLRRDKPFAQVVVPDHKELDRGTLWAILRGAAAVSKSNWIRVFLVHDIKGPIR